MINVPILFMVSSLALEESYKCQSAITVTVKDTVKMGYYLVTKKHNKVDYSCIVHVHWWTCTSHTAVTLRVVHFLHSLHQNIACNRRHVNPMMMLWHENAFCIAGRLRGYPTLMWCYPVEQTVKCLVIWDATMLMWCHCNACPGIYHFWCYCRCRSKRASGWSGE